MKVLKQRFCKRPAIIAVFSLFAIFGCATATYKRERTADFVVAGNAAVVASRTYYDSIIERQNGLLRVLYRNNPECPLAYVVVMRRLVTNSTLAAINDPACRDIYEQSNSFNTLCASADAVRCRNKLAPEDGNLDLRSALGTDFTTKPLSGSDFATSLALIDVITEYLDVLTRFAARDDTEKTFSQRLETLLPRINGVACQFKSLNESEAVDCTPATAASVLKEPTEKSLVAAASLMDLIRALKADVDAAKSIAGVLNEKGAAFDQSLAALILDLESKRKVFLVSGEMSRIELLEKAWAQQAGILKPENREQLVALWIEANLGLGKYLDSPASPIKLLTKLQSSHIALNNLFAGNYTEKDRAEIAELQLKQATEFFKLSFNFVRTLGLL